MAAFTRRALMLLAAGAVMGVAVVLGVLLVPEYYFLAVPGLTIAGFTLNDGARASLRAQAKLPIELFDTVFRGCLEQAFQITEEVKESSESGVLQASESVARIHADLGNHVRDIELLEVRMDGKGTDDSLASVVSKQRTFLESVPQVLRDIEGRTQDLTKTAIEAQTHTSDILGLVGDIRKITKSSKLLAVNALVEAARAGDRGRGFAAVAVTMQHVADQVAAFSDSIAQIGESMAGILPQIATVSDAIRQTCADQATQLASRALRLDEVYDAQRSDLLELMGGLKQGGLHVRTNTNQILRELQFQDRMRQELERVQARTRVPLQVLEALNLEIQTGAVATESCEERLWALVEQVRSDSRLDTTHSDGAEEGQACGTFEMF